MSIKLNAQSGGSVALDAPTQTTSSADLTFKLPVADGSSGQFLKTDGSSALSFASETADFVKIATATWSSAVSSVAVDSLDTSTYKYFIMIWNHKPSEQGRRINFRWRQNSSDQTTAAYDWNFGRYYGASTNYIAENADKVEVTDDMGHDLNEGCQLIFEIYPKTSVENGYHGNAVFWHGIFHENATYVRGISGSAFYDGGTTYYPNGFKLYMNVGNLEMGNYVLYGVKR